MSGVLGWLARRRPWPATLRGQLILILLITVFATQIVALAVFFDERRLAVRAALAHEAISRTASVALLLERTEPVLHPRVIAGASTPLARLRIVGPKATEELLGLRQAPGLARRLRDALGWVSQEAAARQVAVAFALAEDRPHRARDRPRQVRDGEDQPRRRRWRHVDRLEVAVELGPARWLRMTAEFRRPPLQWAWPALMTALLTGVAIAIAVALSVGRTTRPLRRLANAAERFGRGARAEQVALSGPREARRLISAFNGMQERIARFVADRTRLMASISHDIRTPLTAMRLRVEMLEEAETRERLLQSLDEIERMTAATLDFAKQEATDEPVRPLDLAALVDSVVDDFAELGEPVRLGEIAPAVVECRITALTRALRNVISNALRYGGETEVSLVVKNGAALVRVDDRGPGIPEDRIEEMFEPFVRLETSRNRETGGTGLGLSIARTVLRGHGGELRLANRHGGGLRAEISLPLRRKG